MGGKCACVAVNTLQPHREVISGEIGGAAQVYCPDTEGRRKGRSD